MACFARLRYAASTKNFLTANTPTRSYSASHQAAVTDSGNRLLRGMQNHSMGTAGLGLGLQLHFQGASSCVKALLLPLFGRGLGLRRRDVWCSLVCASLHTQVVAARPAERKPEGSRSTGSVLTQLAGREKEPTQLTTTGKGKS